MNKSGSRQGKSAGSPNLKSLMGRGVFSFLLSVFFLLSVITSLVHAQENGTVPKEYIVKAAMIYKMLGFITWPDDEETTRKAPINICVYGKNPFGSYIYALESERFDSRGIEVRTVKDLKGLSDCQVVFISNTEKNRYRKVISKIRGDHVLSISDIKDFSLSGGMIEFVKTGHRIGLVINYGNALNAGIRISSRLLKISKKVYGRNGKLIWSQNREDKKEK